MIDGRTEATAYAKEGAYLKFVCTTDEMFPDVTLKWVLLAEDRSVFQSDLEPRQNVLTKSNRLTGAFVRKSKVEIQMLPSFHRGFLDCQAWFQGTNRIIRSVRLGIKCMFDHYFLLLFDFPSTCTL